MRLPSIAAAAAMAFMMTAPAVAEDVRGTASPDQFSVLAGVTAAQLTAGQLSEVRGEGLLQIQTPKASRFVGISDATAMKM